MFLANILVKKHRHVCTIEGCKFVSDGKYLEVQNKRKGERCEASID